MTRFSGERPTRSAAPVVAAHPYAEPRAQTPKQDAPAATQGPREEADQLHRRVMELEQAGRYDEAIPLARRALDLRETALGPEHPDVAISLNSLAGLLQAKGDYAAAEPLYRRVLAIQEKALGPEHPNVAISLNSLAGLLQAKGDYAAAEPLYRRALAIQEKALGLEHPDVAQSLNDLAELLWAKGDYAAAEPLFRRALAIREKALRPDHLDVAISLKNLALLLRAKGDYAAAEPLFRRALAIRETAFGPNHPDVAASLNNLALLLQAKGEYAAAEPLFRRALAIVEKALGPEHPDVAQSLNNLANLHHAKGDYAAAEPLFRRALAIWEETLGPEHPHVAASLNNLAGLLETKGDHAAAEPLFRRALAIWEETLGPEHPHVAISLNNLAVLLQAKGDPAAAEPLFRRALAIREKALGPEHPEVARSLNSLASLLHAKGDRAAAEPFLRRALAIVERAFGPDHPQVANSLSDLAALLWEKADDATAEALFRRALAIDERALGPEHPRVATVLNNLAALLAFKGDHAAAEPLLRRALAIDERALGPDHPSVARSLDHLAGLHWASSAPTRALPLMHRAAAIRERALASVLATSSERQKQAFASTMQGETDAIVSFHVRVLPDRADAARLALALLLQRKGRTLDAMTDMLAQLRARGRPEDQVKLAQLASLSGELATRTLRGPAPGEDVRRYSGTLARLRADIEELEQDLSTRYKALAAERQAVTLDAVQATLGPGAALVEIAMFRPFNPRVRSDIGRLGRPHYAAYVVHRTGDPRWVELGPAAPIDALVARARAALSAADPRYVEAARALDEKVMQPVRQLLGEAREVYLSPDGALNLVPFAALVDERGQFLLARYRFTYLTSGRDLLRLEVTQTETSRSSPLVLGDPAYDEGGGAPAGATSGRRSDAMEAMHFGPLRWTGPEAREVAKLLPDARLLLDKEATEAAVKALAGPSVVHLATHGFFLAQARAAPLAPREARPFLTVMQPGALPPLPENPLLRSGLALAGANLRRSGSDDGVLTALEVAGLDLWGTKLVVLSACETGVGTLSRGEGVYGLRRALVLAGAESQIMSLWRVADEETQALMTAYYGRLSADEGRSDALREVQLSMARKGLHPFYWAAFIAGGSGRSLSGKEPPAVRQADLPRAADTEATAPE